MITDQSVRHAIKNLIATAQPAATVYEWNALSHDLATWPGLFRTATGTHGWLIKRTSMESEWKHGGRQRPRWIYDIWGFYGFRSGKEGDNSDDEFSAVVASIAEALRATPTLELDEVERHELLQADRLTTIDCGEETLHFAQCRLTVHICC
ncbi:MAG: hypothetical protein R2682_01995 [Pyrinomonadaceae bacterium]